MRMWVLKSIFPLLCLLSGPLQGSSQERKEDFKLRPTLTGKQTGWLDAKDLPTAIKINDHWVLPRGGTMEWLMRKGYVPDTERTNVMKPNPYDKRYREPGPIHVPPLATTPADSFNIGISPRWKKSNDPFEGLADPMKRKFSPTLGAGSNPGLPAENGELGPVLDPDAGLPTLNNSPFAPTQPASRKVPGQADPRNPIPAPDPFSDAEDSPINLQPKPEDRPKVLPGRPIEVPQPDRSNPFVPAKPDA